MTIVDVDIEDLKPAEYNPRQMTPEQVKGLRDSVKKFGLVDPIVVNANKDRQNVVIGGHQRLKIAKEEGMKTVPVVYVDLDEKNEQELNLRLNKNLGQWDWDMLAQMEVDVLREVGFNEQELLKNLDIYSGDEQDDEVPETPEEATSQEGDVFILGEHRILCGDSTREADVEKLMQGHKADMIFTDPPYNIAYKGQGLHTSNEIIGDDVTNEAFDTFLDKAFANCRAHTKPGAGCYVFHASRTQQQFEKALHKNNYEIKNQLIWNKPMSALGWGDYRWKHEPFFYAGQKGESLQFYGDRTHSTVWDFQKTEEQLIRWAKRQKNAEMEGKTTVWSMKRDNVHEYAHPTQKPVELITYALANSTKSGDVVLDLFLGSGSTLIAAEKTGRVCYGMELDPKYVDVIVKRWEDYTGQKAQKE